MKADRAVEWLVADPRGSIDLRSARLVAPSTALAMRLQTQSPLTILHAPPGMGKTCTLLGEFERLRSVGRCPAWIDPGALRLAATRDRGQIDKALPANVDTIILDDAQALDRCALDAIFAVTSGRPNCRLILALRHFDGGGLARRLAQPHVNLIGGDLLAWSRRQFGAEWSTKLSATQVAAIDTLAEGWPGPSQLLARALAHGREIEQQRLYLAESFVSPYIDDELLSSFPAWALPVLSAVALPDSFDQGLLDRLTRSRTLPLAFLHGRLGTLLVKSASSWRFNRLLREHLLARFDCLPPELRRQRTEIVADWLSENNDVVGAARLVSRRGRAKEIAAFTVQAGGLTLWLAKGYDYVRDLVTIAGEAIVASEPRLQLLSCVVLLKEGRIGEAERLYHEAVRRLPSDADARRDAALVQATLTVYGCRVASSRDGGTFRLLERAGSDPGWKTMLPTLRAIRHSQQAEFGAAIAALEEATGHSVAAGITYNLLFLDLHRAGVNLAQGALEPARKTLARATRRWRTTYRDDRGAETVLNALLAQLDFEAGQRRQAIGHLRKSAHRFPHSEAWLDIYVAAYEPMLRLLAEEHGVSAAKAAITQAVAQLHEQSLTRIADLLHALCLCLEGEACLRGGLTEAFDGDCDAILHPRDLADQTWQEIEFRGLARAYVALSAGADAEARRELDRLAQFAEQKGLRRTELRVRLLRCACFDRLLLRDLADGDFHRALEIAQETGLRRAFWDFGGRHVEQRVDAVHARALPARLRAVLDDIRLTRWNRLDPDDRPLTRREVQVAQELQSGGSDKWIGRRLGITEHAVRFHLKSIYRKLAVHNRHDAVARLRQRMPTAPETQEIMTT